MRAKKISRLSSVASCTMAVLALLFAIRGGMFNSAVGHHDGGPIPTSMVDFKLSGFVETKKWLEDATIIPQSKSLGR